MTIQYAVKSKKELPKSLSEFDIEIPAEALAPLARRVLEHAVRETELPGFRKGFVPEKIVRERIGELELWERAAGEALAAALPEMFRAEAIDAIGQPTIAVTMLAPGNSLLAKITVARIPQFILPDYKKIAARANEKLLALTGEPQAVAPGKVEEKEVDAVIAELRKIRTGEDPKSPAEAKEGAIAHPRASESLGETGSPIVEPLTDENAKQFGNFNSVAELKAVVSENLKRQKEEQEKQKRRGALLSALVSETKVELPDILIESELARMEAELERELKRFGATLPKYLAEIKKTEDELRNEFRPDAEHRARVHLLLHKIAAAENITAPPEKVDEEVKRILSEHKNADPEAMRVFVETFLTNQSVIQFLENQ